jgi:hypothetical protein
VAGIMDSGEEHRKQSDSLPWDLNFLGLRPCMWQLISEFVCCTRHSTRDLNVT